MMCESTAPSLSSMHRTAAVLAYSDHSAPTLPLTEGVPSLFGNSAVVAVPTTTSVPLPSNLCNGANTVDKLYRILP